MTPFVFTLVLAGSFFLAIGFILSGMILFAKKLFIKAEVCQITINDEIVKEVDGGGTLLFNLLDLGFSVPSPCGGKATCLQCRVRVTSGGGEILETDRSTFTPSQLKEGWRLSCQCKVKKDLNIILPASQVSTNKFVGEVVSNENVATFIKELIIKIPADFDPKYIPGDYFQFHIPAYKTNTSDWKKTIAKVFHSDWERFKLFDRKIIYEPIEDVVRAFSCASYPAEKGVLKFNIRIASPPIEKGRPKWGIPWGIGSSYLFSLRENDKVEMSGPHGESHMIDDDRELVFLIGGAGSSFGRSHIFDLFETKKTKRKVTLWYGARSLRENIYESDFKALVDRYPNFTYNIVLSDPLEEDFAAGWPRNDPLKTNFVYKAFEEGQLNRMSSPETCLYYVCGPPMHNKMVMKLLGDAGVPRENIILDDFGN